MADVSDVRITVTEEEFVTAIEQFKSCKENFSNAYLQEIAAVFSLDSSWNGDASEEFKKQFDAMQKNLQSSDTVMDSFVAELTKRLTKYQEASEEASKAFNAMQDTVDPFAEG